jgi:CTP:molybdopterin cytidylyltransferase MocA
MTVAAIILAATPESALADADGMPAVRRIADAAWSGGATPIVVVADDPDGAIASALAGAPVTLAEPAPADAGPVGQIVRGIEVAADRVHETGAVLIWPARVVWTGPETVTSMIEAHGTSADAVITPEYEGERGWPVLVPLSGVAGLRQVRPDRMPDDVVTDLVAGGAPELRLDLGDPGTTHDRTVARSALPPYRGPLEPAGGHVHEWGAVVADEADDGPLEGPSLAPYGQAVAADPEQPG